MTRTMLLVAMVGGFLGCREAAAPVDHTPTAPTTGVTPQRPSGLGIESEIGALNEAEVKQTFRRAAPNLYACFSQGTQRLPYLNGEVRFVVRVAHDGTARWAFLKDSTLGDRKTETCMLSVLKALAWPKPQGGDGLAETPFTFEPSADERLPVVWSVEQLGAPFMRAKGTLSECRKQAGSKGLKATFYVETNGKTTSIGVSTADEHGERAVDCVLNVLSNLQFPSPGSFAAKVSVNLD